MLATNVFTNGRREKSCSNTSFWRSSFERSALMSGATQACCSREIGKRLPCLKFRPSAGSLASHQASTSSSVAMSVVEGVATVARDSEGTDTTHIKLRIATANRFLIT